MLWPFNISILRKYMLNYLGVKGHVICNLLSNGSEKNMCVCTQSTNAQINSKANGVKCYQ